MSARSPFRRSASRTVGAMLCVAGLLGALSCAPAEPLRVGLLVWPAYEPPFLARAHGALSDGSVELVDFRSPGEVMRAYRHGLIDVLALTGGYALELAAESDDHRIVMVVDFSAGGDALLAHPRITSLEDLRGARIGLDNTNLGFHMLARVLERAGLGRDDVQAVAVSVAEHEDAYLSGRVDAIITYEPMVARLRAAGARVLFDSRAIPGEIVDVLITRERVLDERYTALSRLVEAWFLGQQILRDAPLDAARAIAPREGLTPEAFLDALEGIDLVDREQNRALLADGSRLAAALRSVADLLGDYGAELRGVNVDRLLDDRLVRSPERARGNGS